MSAPQANVPKFGSFKPRPAAQITDPEKPQTESQKHVKHSSRSIDEKREKRRHKPHRSRSKERETAKVEDEPIRASPHNGSPEIFLIDRKGDVNNLVYGSVHKYSVPPFYRYGAGYVLGASLDVKIDRSRGEDKNVVLRNWRVPRTREKYVFSRIEKLRPRLLKIRPEILTETDSNLESDFVPLQPSRGRNRRRSAGHESSDDEKRDYRSIYGKPKENGRPVDEDLQEVTESDSSGSDAGRDLKMDSSIRQLNVELSRKVEQFPQDVKAWLALIDHQDVMMRAGDDRRRITNAEIRSTADIKIHMYEKALEKAQSLEGREKLLLGLMAEGTKIWEVKVQSDRWEQISKDNIDSLLLWTGYLNFKQSTFVTFRYDDLREVYLKRVRLLSGSIDESTNGARDGLYQELLYVILRLTLFIREAGYTELAVAIWQGLLAMNFNAPKERPTKSTMLESFKAFWESEVPRIGEAGSLGWSHFVANSSESEIPDPVTDEVDDSLNIADIFRSWSAAERIRMKSSQIPARTMDEVVEDDPYRVIMFSDIEDFLIPLPSDSESLHTSCIEAFLLFCRLPPMATPNSETSRKWANDQFVRNELLECTPAWIKDEYFSKRHNEDPDIGVPSFLHIPFPNCVSIPDLLFGKTLAGNDYFGSPLSQQSSIEARYGGDNGPVSTVWLRNTLKQLVQAPFTEDLAEYYLAFEFHHSPKTIKKIAKGLLKQYPSSLRLYNAYAMIEWSRGNRETANGVFSAALNMSTSSTIANLHNGDKNQANESIILYRNWAWLTLETTDNSSALQRLLSIADGKQDTSIAVSPTILLRAKQHLSSTRDFLCSAGNYSHAVLYTECLALLTYLTATSTNEPQSPAQGSILPALDIYQAFTTSLLARSLTKSQIHTPLSTLAQSLTRLLTHHTSRGPFRPSLLRTTLTAYLNLLPSSTTLLTLYTRTETHLRISNRVRTLLSTSTLSPENDCLSSRLFEIKYELENGTVHSVRAAFERAVHSDAGKGAAGLWKLYLLFCLSGDRDQSNEMRGKAKDVWLRGLRACPWAKELYVVGMEELGGGEGGVSYEELRATWTVMGEKELRVHVDLEDAFEEIGELGRSGGQQKRVASR